MKQAVRVKLWRVTNYEQTWPSSNLLEFVHWLAQKIAIIPEEHRSNAEIEIEREDPWESGGPLEIHIYYLRLETDEEEFTREKYNKLSEESKVAAELRLLADLKAKYEQPKPDNI